ncbi:MAG: ribosome maturation factor RimP [Christensenella sp.]|uniref:ribosome maturation factor RimP n=1 Tax=Christensenella sp. TaxID=1935934 RepID=UPI002B1EBE42|nr:ribosome maturation factor RimP [Christensenella sp.]MEA5003872.1 ribosome maturation factor RimP [Christensenella sp.]
MAKNVKLAVEEIARPIIEDMGLIYIDTEYAKQGQDWMLTIFMDKDGGVLLDDCELVSRAVEAVLDEQDPVAESYCLCVSSPGLDRELKTEGDFARSMGKAIDIKLYKPFEGSKLFTGILTGHAEGTVTIETDANEIVFEKSEIAKINLHLDI